MLRIISLCLTIERQLLCSERDIGVVRCEGNSLDPHHLRTSRHKPEMILVSMSKFISSL